ncbi:MAG: response regulator, partial [Flavobacteriales bacterium]
MTAGAERITVLYVDDEPGNLSGFKSNFRREFNVLIANSGTEALELLAKHDVHVVISDQRMPGMEGADLLAIVKDRHPQAVRMLMTAYADVQAVIDAVNKGNIFGYATKPYDPADLRIRIEQAASLATARRDRDRTHARYKQVFENAGDPIVIVDDKAAIVQANP